MTKSLNDISYEQSFELFLFDNPTGNCFWKEVPEHWFASAEQAKWGNERHAGKLIESSAMSGYIQVSITGWNGVPLHRLIWLQQTGKWPEGVIDHINGVRDDNRLENLRDVSKKENARNRAIGCDNRVGAIGLFPLVNKRFGVRISVEGKMIYLGSYDSFEEAVEARRLANIKYGYHENHGRPTVA